MGPQKGAELNIDLPIVVITRPPPEAQRLAEALRLAGATFQAVFSPLFTVEPLGDVVTLQPGTEVIFTSVNGVRHARFSDEVVGRVAWCVGDATAQAAQAAGFEPKSAAGTAKHLVDLILSHGSRSDLLHIRGVHAHGNILHALTSNGLNVAQAVVYTQVPKALTAQARALLSSGRPVILPVFSPKTAETLVQQGPFGAPLVFVAISDMVADVLQNTAFESISVAGEPNLKAMVASICAALRGNRSASSP